MKRKRKQEGWTLVELIIVIVILGLIAAVTIPAYIDMTSSAEINGCQAAQATIRSAVSMYYAKNKGNLPKELKTDMFVNNEIPKCPCSGKITYKLISSNEFIVECSIEKHNTPVASP